MTITKRTIATHSADINGRIQVKEYNQVIETTQDEDGNDVIEIIKSAPHAGVIDPSQGDYDAKVKALGEKLTGQLAARQESNLRKKEAELECKECELQAEKDECVKHKKIIAALESKILELEAANDKLKGEVK